MHLLGGSLGEAVCRYTKIIIVDALFPVQFWSTKCLKWSIVICAYVPRQVCAGKGPGCDPLADYPRMNFEVLPPLFHCLNVSLSLCLSVALALSLYRSLALSRSVALSRSLARTCLRSLSLL
jgi:hypothetical protein